MLTRRQFIKKCLFSLAGAYTMPYLIDYGLSHASGNPFPVLLYHRVGPETDALTIQTTRFAKDLQYLFENGYRTLSYDEAKEILLGQEPLAGKPVLITFDDGYVDNYTNAFPLLQSYSMSACFFIITGMLGLPNRMSESQIREMSFAGMTIGSHTVSHRQLGNLSATEASHEFAQSKSELEDILSKAVDVVAYPCGSYNQDTLSYALKTGYNVGFTTKPGLAESHASLLEVNRIPIFHYTRPLSDILR